jgi:hypothetical protein
MTAFAATGAMGLTSPWAMTALVMKPANVYIVVSYRCGVGSIVPGGHNAINLPIDKVLACNNSAAFSTGAPNVASNLSGEI